MGATWATRTSVCGVLTSLAESGTMTVHSAEIAKSAGLKKDTVMRFGREQDGAFGLNPHNSSGRWRATYSRGRFTVAESEDFREPEPVVAPDWFELPTGLVKRERHSTCDIGQRRALTYQFVQECIDGHIALAPWQRGEVWTETQQVALLDSMMSGISIGALTMWHRPRSESLEGARSLPGCSKPEHGYLSAKLIVDGQQRATTLVRAALGHLDHWRWNGHEWASGKGFLTPRLAVYGALELDDHYDWSRILLDGLRDRGDMFEIAYRQSEAIKHTELSLMVLGGTATEMVETYRRLATHGSPHSPEDLAVMEDWFAEHTRLKGGDDG